MLTVWERVVLMMKNEMLGVENREYSPPSRVNLVDSNGLNLNLSKFHSVPLGGAIPISRHNGPNTPGELRWNIVLDLGGGFANHGIIGSDVAVASHCREQSNSSPGCRDAERDGCC